MAIASISQPKQYLTFKLADELFAVDVAKVREILECSTITRVPQTPGFMCGVINLRGRAVPVIDMRLKFGMAAAARTVDSCIIVVEVEQGAETLVIGALADSVQEVFELEPGSIEAPPRIGTKLNIDFIAGMGRHGDQFIIILEIDRVFGREELALVQEAGEGAAAGG